MKLSIINAIGCAGLLILAAIQWISHEALRHSFLDAQKSTHQITQERDEANEKITALKSDIADLKRALTETQQAAADASQDALEREEQIKAIAGAGQSLQTERDALRAQVTTWEAAIKERDTTITQLNTDLIALRKKLDQAITELKKAGAR